VWIDRARAGAHDALLAFVARGEVENVVLRANMALGVSRHVRGAEAVARQARMYHTLDRFCGRRS
jgi:hypothetical protein